MPHVCAKNEARVLNLILIVMCELCNKSFAIPHKQLSTSHYSNDGKRPGMYFGFQCPDCLTWHTEVPLYKTHFDERKS